MSDQPIQPVAPLGTGADQVSRQRLRNDLLLLVAGAAVGWRLSVSPATTAATAALIGIGLLLQRRVQRSQAAIRADLIHLGMSTVLLDILVTAVIDRFDQSGFLSSAPLWSQAIALFVAVDGMSYATHRVMHTWDATWAFHKAHHAPEGLDVLVAFRRHPLGELLQRGPILAVTFLLGPDPVVAVGVFGFFTVWGIAIHANWDPPGSGIIPCLVTPRRHLHHHGRGMQANFGGVLLIWDRMFGTLATIDAAGTDEIGEIGTPEDWWAQFREPFDVIGSRIRTERS